MSAGGYVGPGQGQSVVECAKEMVGRIVGRGLHSSTIRLNVSTFCGIRRVHDFPPLLLVRGTSRGVTNTA